MASSTAKRLILYRFDRPPVEAFVHADAYLQEAGVEVMLLDGSLQVVDYQNLKALCFAAEGAPADLFLAHYAFDEGLKMNGLWVSFRLRDDDVLEGILPHNLAEWPVEGFYLSPPKPGAHRQRVFLPRQAIRENGGAGGYWERERFWR